jgi:hypothetical protein
MLRTIDHGGSGELCRGLRERDDDAGEEESACDEGLHFICISNPRYREKCCGKGNPLSGMYESKMKLLVMTVLRYVFECKERQTPNRKAREREFLIATPYPLRASLGMIYHLPHPTARVAQLTNAQHTLPSPSPSPAFANISVCLIAAIPSCSNGQNRQCQQIATRLACGQDLIMSQVAVFLRWTCLTGAVFA